MIEQIFPETKMVRHGLVNFYHPFEYNMEKSKYHDLLRNDGWQKWNYNDDGNHIGAYYGGLKVSNFGLKQYYLDHVGRVLFADISNDYTFDRFSKIYNLTLKYKNDEVKLLSADVFLCGIGIGFLVLKIDYYSWEGKNNFFENPKQLDNFISFVESFRSLNEEWKDHELGSIIHAQEPANVYDFIIRFILPDRFPIVRHSTSSDYSSSGAPYIYNSRMFTQVYVAVTGRLNKIDKFKIANIDGDILSSNNEKFVDDFNSKHFYCRWAPEFVYSVIDYAVVTIVDYDSLDNNGIRFEKEHIRAHFYTCYYYMLLLQLFYRSALLKLSYDYSQLKKDDIDKAKELLHATNEFKQRYYYLNVTNQLQGKELWASYTELLDNSKLFEEVKQEISEINTLLSNKRQEELNNSIRMLTILSVLSSIFGISRFAGTNNTVTLSSIIDLFYKDRTCAILTLDNMLNIVCFVVFICSLIYVLFYMFLFKTVFKNLYNRMYRRKRTL